MSGGTTGSRDPEVWSHALATFGSADKARAWMARPTPLLGNRSPAELLATDGGA